MILVASPSKPFEYTAKLTPRRQAIIKAYDPEIAALYAAVEQSAQLDIGAPPAGQWDDADPENVRAFVRQNIWSVLRKHVEDTADLFQHGCDSLQATWIRNTILRALRAAHPSAGRALGSKMDLVYENPSIERLVSRVTEAVREHPEPKDDSRLYVNGETPAHASPNGSAKAEVSRVDEMLRTVEEYSANFPLRSLGEGARTRDGRDVVLLTGTTSGLGTDLLAHLLADPSVARVYTFNRHLPDRDVVEVQRTSFRDRGLDEGLLSAERWVSVEGEGDRPGFGINPELFEEVSRDPSEGRGLGYNGRVFTRFGFQSRTSSIMAGALTSSSPSSHSSRTSERHAI